MKQRIQGDLYEKSLAERLREQTIARVVSGSGSTPHNKEDIKTERWLIQAKSCVTQSHSIKKDELISLRRHAENVGRLPLYVVGFFNLESELRSKNPQFEEWVLMPMSLLMNSGLLEKGLGDAD